MRRGREFRSDHRETAENDDEEEDDLGTRVNPGLGYLALALRVE